MKFVNDQDFEKLKGGLEKRGLDNVECVTHLYFVKQSIIVKIYLNPSNTKFGKKKYVNLVSFSWIIRFNRFYLYIFLVQKKRLHSILHIFLMKLALCF